MPHTVGDRSTKNQNPKNEPSSIKTLDLTIKVVLIGEVEIPPFAETQAKVQRNFGAVILKWQDRVTAEPEQFGKFYPP